MTSLIAPGQSKYYQTVHQIPQWVSIWNPPFLGFWICLLEENIKSTCMITVYMFSHYAFQSLFAKLLHADIMHRYRDVSLKDSLYEYDLPIYDALEPPFIQVSIWNFQRICPIYLGKVTKFQHHISSRFKDIQENPKGWIKTILLTLIGLWHVWIIYNLAK